MAVFYYKSTCSTCRNARKLLQELGRPFEERDMSRGPLSADELRALIGERDIRPFLNPRNELYRERGMKAAPPAKEEAIALMAENPNLIRRPLLVEGETILYGFDEATYRQLGS
jgi:arsenate reductase (glutaredoxin)